MSFSRSFIIACRPAEHGQAPKPKRRLVLIDHFLDVGDHIRRQTAAAVERQLRQGF